MAAKFVVVDGDGSTVDLAELVQETSLVLAESGASTEEDAFAAVKGLEDLSLRVSGVRVCMGFQFSGTSHTGRKLESETREVCE